MPVQIMEQVWSMIKNNTAVKRSSTFQKSFTKVNDDGIEFVSLFMY